MAKNKKLPYSKKLAKILGLLISFLIIYFVIKSLRFDDPRFVYCLDNDECVTVWRKNKKEIFIVMGKYGGDSIPEESHIITDNEQLLTLYFSDSLPDKIVVKNEGNMKNIQGEYEMIEGNGRWTFVDFTYKYDSILYKPNSISFNDVYSWTEYLNIFIKENFATDKTGKKIKPL